MNVQAIINEKKSILEDLLRNVDLTHDQTMKMVKKAQHLFALEVLYYDDHSQSGRNSSRIFNFVSVQSKVYACLADCALVPVKENNVGEYYIEADGHEIYLETGLRVTYTPGSLETSQRDRSRV